MDKRLLRLIVVTIVLVCSVGAQAQRRNSRYVTYIDKYKDLAIEQMKEHKIPASITLAQGLLESGAGMSELARKSNNHFGIKCGGSWKGRTVRHAQPQSSHEWVRSKDIPTFRALCLKYQICRGGDAL